MDERTEKLNKHFREKQVQQRISLRKLLYVSIIKDWVVNHNVLDIGCGDGLIDAWLSSVCKIVGSDIDVERVRILCKNMEFIKLDIVNDPIDSNCCETALCLDVLEHIPEKDETKVLKKLYLLPSKQLIIGFPLKPDISEFDRVIDLMKILNYFTQCGMMLVDYQLLTGKYALMRFLK